MILERGIFYENSIKYVRILLQKYINNAYGKQMWSTNIMKIVLVLFLLLLHQFHTFYAVNKAKATQTQIINLSSKGNLYIAQVRPGQN